MKRIAIFSAFALVAGAAHADPISVATPKADASAQEASAYVEKLDIAVKRVCHSAFSPIIGINYFSYKACLEATRADVAKNDPTGQT
ncbi:MAG: hypothetical protein EON93_25280 [Burkholderiales bacterium]|nr:MAG: hypothetical protein EON93_25280 [Burkholderiales bacterium]